jgi:carbon-monoxide dehydrogenase small subunit
MSDESRTAVHMTVNGVDVERTVPDRMLLSDFLRHELRLTGTHVGCEHGVCGCCTVVLDGRTARSCLTLAAQCRGSAVTTIEGLAGEDGTLHPVQRAFVDAHGLQCGFCTPGFVMTVREYLDERPGYVPGDDEIRAAIAGNLCRCTGYQSIVAAVKKAAETLASGR